MKTLMMTMINIRILVQVSINLCVNVYYMTIPYEDNDEAEVMRTIMTSKTCQCQV